MGLTREQVKAERQRLGIGTTFPAKLAFNKGLSENRTIEIHNQYAKQIFTEAYGDDPVLADLAKQYISELPKAARKGQEREYIAACEAKLEAFRGAVRDYNLAINQGIIDANAQQRHEEGEVAADLRAAHSDQITVQTGNRVIQNVNEHTDQVGQQVTQNVNANTNRVGNSVVRRVNAHTTAETNRGIAANAQNTSAMLGVDAEGYTQRNDDGERILANGNAIADDASAVGQVNAHTDEAAAAVNQHTDEAVKKGVDEVNAHTDKAAQGIKLDAQRQAVLDAKRQTISDMLMHEDSAEWGGVYRDSTVKWLGSAADRVMGDTKLTFEQKKEALDELVRMVDEENVISDGDKTAFEGKYFWDHEQHPQV